MKTTEKKRDLYESPTINEMLFSSEGVLCGSPVGGLEGMTESEGEWDSSFLNLD